MSRLSVGINDELSVYESRIFELADEYVESVLDGDYERVPESFMGLIYHISDNIPEIPNDNIDLMDAVFDLYCRLCARLNVLPSLETFAILVKTNRATFSDWRNQEYRANDLRYAESVRRWKSVCKSHLVNRLANTNKTSVNLIFLAKASYDMTEAVSQNTEMIPGRRIKSADELPDFRKLYGGKKDE